MATAFLLLLLFFTVFSTITTTTAQQTSRNSNITIDSFLTAPTNNTNSSSSWLSRSGLFAFGFYPLQDGGFVVGIWFAGIPQKTVVWTAPILVKQTDSNNFRLRLTRDQGLVLQSTQGQLDQSISADISGSASYASMLDTGNMVLYNSNSTIIWQSFDYPTDTILQGQPLRVGRSLFSKASETDYSRGRFLLDMQTDGNLVAYPAEPSPGPAYAYWSTGTYTAGDNVTVNLDDDGRLYLINTNGTESTYIMNVSQSDNKAPNGAMFYRLTIDTNGILNLYSHNLLDRNNNWSVKWTAPGDKCAPKGLCGINGYCILMDQEIDCLCLPGFDFIDSGRRTLGCERVVRLESCGSAESEQRQDTMNTITKTTWEDNAYSVLTSITEEECKAACLKDCNCEVVMFENLISCRKQKLPLRYGRRNILGGTVTTFIKVSTQNMTPTSTPTTTTIEGPSHVEQKKRKRSKKEEKKWSILIAGVSFISGFLLVIAISGFVVISIGYRSVIGFYP